MQAKDIHSSLVWHKEDISCVCFFCSSYKGGSGERIYLAPDVQVVDNGVLLPALTLPLVTQVYKWVPANLLLGVTLRWTSIPSRG